MSDTHENGKSNCPSCKGKGKKPCSNPDHDFIMALGTVGGRSPSESQCPECGFSGESKCDYCNGTGTITYANLLVYCDEIERERNEARLMVSQTNHQLQWDLCICFACGGEIYHHMDEPFYSCQKCGITGESGNIPKLQVVKAECDQLRKVCDALAKQYRYEMMSMFGHAADCDCSRCEPMTYLYNSLPHVIERNKSK